MSMSKEDLNPWAALEDQLEQMPTPVPPKIDLKASVERRPNLLDRLHGMVFNGFVICLTIILATLVMEIRYNFAIALSATIPLLLLGVMLAPVFSGSRRPLWFYALTAPVMAGSFFMILGGTEIVRENFIRTVWLSPQATILLFQSRIESWATFETMLVCLLGGTIGALLAFRVQKRLPWFEPKVPGKTARLTALTMCLSPLVFLLACQVYGRVQEKEASFAWYTSTVVRHPAFTSKREAEVATAPWAALYERWYTHEAAKNLGKRDTLTSKTYAVSDLRSLEASFMSILKNRTNDAALYNGAYLNLKQILLDRIDDLANPHLFMKEILAAESAEVIFGPASIEGLLHWLQKGEASQQQLEELLPLLERYQKRQTIDVDLLDAIVLRGLKEDLFSSTAEGGPKPLTLFGYEVARSPHQLYFQWKLAKDVQPWLDIRSKLQGKSRVEILTILESEVRTTSGSELALDKPLASFPDSVLESIYNFVDYRNVPEFIEFARVVVAAGLYKFKHGQYPDDPEQLLAWVTLSGEPGRWVLERKDEKLKITDSLLEQLHPGYDKEWLLP